MGDFDVNGHWGHNESDPLQEDMKESSPSFGEMGKRKSSEVPEGRRRENLYTRKGTF